MSRSVADIDAALAAIEARFAAAREVPSLPAVTAPADADEMLLRHLGTQSSKITANDLRRYAAGLAKSTKAANYTVTAADFNSLIKMDATAGAVTVTLPLASAVGARFQVEVQKSDSSANAVSYATTGGDALDGPGALATEDQAVKLVSDGVSSWTALPNTLGEMTDWFARVLAARAMAKALETDSSGRIRTEDGYLDSFVDDGTIGGSTNVRAVNGRATPDGLATEVLTISDWNITSGTFAYINPGQFRVSASNSLVSTSTTWGDANVRVDFRPDASWGASAIDSLAIAMYDSSQVWNLASYKPTIGYGIANSAAGNSVYEIYEAGTQVSTFAWSSGDIISIVKTGTSMTIELNGAVIHTFSSAITGSAVRIGVKADGDTLSPADVYDFTVVAGSTQNTATLLEDAYATMAPVGSAFVILVAELPAAITLGTNLIVRVSPDGGTTKTIIPMTVEDDFGGGLQVLRGESQLSTTGSDVVVEIDFVNLLSLSSLPEIDSLTVGVGNA